MDYILIIKMLSLTWFITHFEPMQNILNKISFKNEWIQLINRFIKQPLQCWKCGGFWITLAITQAFWPAIIVSMVAWFIDNNYSSIKL